MRSIHFNTFVALWVALPLWVASAGTLQNDDFDQYYLNVGFPNGRTGREIIEGNSTIQLCGFDGCELELVKTGQTVRMGPNDTVTILNGRMSVHTPLIPGTP